MSRHYKEQLRSSPTGLPLKPSPTVGRRDALFVRELEMKARGKWQGMLTIARFNWPFYAGAIAVVALSLAGLLLLDRADFRVACAITLAASAYFLVGSLGVSHFIYDRSDLYRWGWLERALRG